MDSDIDIGEKLGIKENLGVFEETAPLKKVLMWGEPGAEAVLGILLPTSISHFQEPFDIIKARDEFRRSKRLLEDNGVEVILVKELLAKLLFDQGFKTTENMERIKQRLLYKGNNYHKEHPSTVSKDDSVNITGWPQWLEKTLDEDLEKYGSPYGEEVAVGLNLLCSDRNGDLPLANLMYARDQSNLLGNTWVFSSMRHLIRQPEVDIYYSALSHAGILNNQDLDTVSVSGNGRFEGGDGIIHNNIVYVGAGGRTNKDGILQFAPSILKSGRRLMVVFDSQRDTGELDEMDAMHLDTFWMPVGPDQVVSCSDEVCRRELLEVVSSNGDLRFESRGWFGDYLKTKDIVPLTKDEQIHYAPNFLNLGNERVILSLSEGNSLTSELSKRGKTVMCAGLTQITKGYGGLHCMTAAIKRG